MQTSLHSLISAFVIRLLESIVSRLATSGISIYLLVSVAEQAGLNLAFVVCLSAHLIHFL